MKRTTKPRVLVVDDEENIQRGLRMLLRKEFDVTTASSGAEGLEFMSSHPEWDVVMSDMRMPGMDGAEFLARAHAIAPNSVRVLLTGQADVDSAVAAVNEGQVFRFMTKPCSPVALRKVLGEAADHRDSLTAETRALESILSESLLVLSEVLGTIHPVASLRCGRLRTVVRHVCESQGYEGGWQLDLAAALSLLGCIPLPTALVGAALRAEELNESDQGIWEGHPSWGAELIAAIPRLESVAYMIRNQRNKPPAKWAERPLAKWPVEVLGAEVLRTVEHYLQALVKRPSAHGVLATMETESSYQDSILEALASLPPVETSGQEREVRAADLRAGMTLLEDLKASVGLTLACEGAIVSPTLVRLAQNFSARGELREPFRVQSAPESAENDQ